MTDITSITAAAVLQVPVVFTAMTPTAETILGVRTAQGATKVQHSVTIAAVVSLGIGCVLSIVARDGTPFLATAAVTILMVALCDRMTRAQYSDTESE